MRILRRARRWQNGGVKLLAFLGVVLAGTSAVGFADDAPVRFMSDDGSGRWGAKRFGYRDAEGRVIVPAVYQVAEEFTPEGLAAVARNGRAGLIDEEGRAVIASAGETEAHAEMAARRLALPELREGFGGEPLAMFVRTEAGYRGQFGMEKRTGLPTVDFRREVVVGLASCTFCASLCDHARGVCHRNGCSYRRVWWAVRVR